MKKITPNMLNELDRAARHDQVNARAYGVASRGRVDIGINKRTAKALEERGLITYTYRRSADTPVWTYLQPVLTPAGWAMVCPEGRPLDGGRYTLEEAYAAV